MVLAALNWDDAWWLALVGAFSYSFALRGLSCRQAPPSRDGCSGMFPAKAGSYIAMTTAVLVVNFGTASVLAWIAPTLIGSPLIAYVNTQIAKGKRPKSRPDLAGTPAAAG